MKRALVFVCAFVISSMVIYSVYYYSRVNKLSSGIVATADQLPKTKFATSLPKHFSDTNYIASLGLLEALTRAGTFKPQAADFETLPTENSLSAVGEYSKDFVENLNIGISGKFPNHPPIGFNNLNDGDKVIFSYFFKNILLPKEFSSTTTNINGKHFRAIQYMDSIEHVLTVSIIEDTLEMIYIETLKDKIVFSKHKMQDSIGIRLSPPSKPVVFPELDFNIIKYWKPEEAYFIPDAKKYKHLEERAKLKLTTSITQDPTTTNIVELKPPYYMYLYKKGAVKPYFAMYIANTELLLPAYGK